MSGIWQAVVAYWRSHQLSEPSLFAVGFFISQLLGYWLPVGLLALVDRHSRRHPGGLLARLRINPADKQPPEDLVRENLLKSLFNLLVGYPLLSYHLLYHTCRDRVFSPAPELGVFVWQIALFFVINDTWFYWTHRLAHDGSGPGGGLGRPGWYQRVHKAHHRFTWTVGLAANGNASVWEDLLINLLGTLGPVVGLSLVVPVHGSVYLVYTAIRMWEGVEGHSGFSNPFSFWHYLRSNDFHCYHHQHYNRGNFGIFPWWDQLCGTDKCYRRDRRLQGKRWWN